MSTIGDGHLHQVFVESNVYSFDYDKYLRVLDVMLKERGLDSSDVLALSEASGLIVVFRDGVARGDLRGIFNKRVEVERFVSFDKVDRLLREQRQPHGRESWIKLLDGNGRTLLESVWHCGGPVEIADAARERDRVYEAMLSAARAPRHSAHSATVPSISEFSSKRDYLMAWGNALLLAAGAPTTPALVEEHANMAAGAVRMMVFLRLGAPHGIDDLNQDFPDGGFPAGTPLDSFDSLYGRVAQREGGAQAVDPEITAFLDGCWSDWVRGAREAHA